MYHIKEHKVRHIIHPGEPSVKSYGSLLMLNYDLRIQDKDYLLSNWKIPVLYNIEFLKKRLAIKGVLECSYCQKGPLVINEDLTKDPPKQMLATVDHVIPKAKGGEHFNYGNLTVSCYKCNMTKGASIGIKIDEDHYTWTR